MNEENAVRVSCALLSIDPGELNENPFSLKGRR